MFAQMIAPYSIFVFYSPKDRWGNISSPSADQSNRNHRNIYIWPIYVPIYQAHIEDS